jgi:hypothetical protein
MQNRRTLFTALGTGALVSLLSSTRRTVAQATTAVPPTNTKTIPSDPFILLLRGIYEPVSSGAPDLGVKGINGQYIDLNDGSWSKTRIYPVFGIPDSQDEKGSYNNVPTTPIGNFYAQLAAFAMGTPLSQINLAYELPGGAITQRSISGNFAPPINNMPAFPDGKGGQYLEGSFDLTILDATGAYKTFIGGHNNMVDRLHALADGNFDEFCFCHISKYEYPYAPVGVFPPPSPSMDPMPM